MFEFIQIAKQTIRLTKSLWGLYNEMGVKNVQFSIGVKNGYKRLSFTSELPFETKIATHVDIPNKWVNEELMKMIETEFKKQI